MSLIASKLIASEGIASELIANDRAPIFYGLSRMLQFSQFVWTLCYSV